MKATTKTTEVLDLVIFTLKGDATREQFLGTVDAVSQWARSQPGFVSRDLSYNADQGKWIEMVRWVSVSDADTAAQVEMTAEECLPMFALIDTESMLYLRGDPAIDRVSA